MKIGVAPRTIFAGALLAIALASLATAAPQITVTDAWIRALPGKLPAGGYFTLHNGTGKTVTLSGASSAACGMLMLHRSESMSGMSTMSDVVSIEVPAGATLKFAPGSYHLMCMDPASALKPGGRVTVTLQFTDGTKLPVTFAVRGANGR
jgi:copper(I)-binding protein